LIAWRVTRAPFADLSGTGAKLYGGRWNSPGTSAVYLSEHPALCLLEIFVNLGINQRTIPIDYVLMTVVVPDSLLTESAPSGIPFGQEAKFGDAWIAARRTPVLWVPSVVMPQSYNLVVNPEHPASAAVFVRDITPFQIDPRLSR
jgi:RES domain-containing protein